MSLFVSDLSITGITDNGESITFNISPNTTGEELELSIISGNNHSLEYSLSNGSLHLSDLNISSSGFSNNTTQETYPFDPDESPIGSPNGSFISPNGSFISPNGSFISPNNSQNLNLGGKKSRKLKKRNKNKKKRKTKKNKTKCIY